MRVPLTFWILPLLFMADLSAADAGKPVVVNQNLARRRGTVLREQLLIAVERGTTRVEAKSGNRELATLWRHRYTLVRRIQGGGAEEVDVRDHACATGLFPPGAPPPVVEQRGPLVNKTLRARRRAVGWEYLPKEGKAAPAELSCLLDLGFLNGVLEIIPAALGTRPRKPGEGWKETIPAPRGKAHGLAVFKDVEAALGSIEQRPDGPHARLFISGSFTMQRPMGYNAAVESTFAITLVRRLSDMLDVEMKITGVFKNSYEVNYQASEGAVAERATFRQELPYTLTRSLQIEGR
jgi:hypothetical protein